MGWVTLNVSFTLWNGFENFFRYRFVKKKTCIKPEKKKQTLMPFSPKKSRFHEKNFNDAECIDGNITIICRYCNYPIYKVSATNAYVHHQLGLVQCSQFPTCMLEDKNCPNCSHASAHHKPTSWSRRTRWGKTNYSNLTIIKQSNLPS